MSLPVTMKPRSPQGFGNRVASDLVIEEEA